MCNILYNFREILGFLVEYFAPIIDVVYSLTLFEIISFGVHPFEVPTARYLIKKMIVPFMHNN